MPRPSEQGIVDAHNTQGFTPSAPANFQTQVVAPLDVDAAPTQAMALAKALGHANASLQPTLGEMARQQGSSDEASGEADAALGNVDPEKQKIVSGYATGVVRVQTEQTALQASLAAKTFYSQHPDLPLQDTTAPDGTVTKGLISSVDDIFRSHFPAGEEKDPEQARAMAPLLQHTIQEIAGAKTNATIRNTQQTAEDTATGLLMHDVQTGSQSFNVADQLAKFTQVYGGDQRAARDALVHSIGEAAVSTGKPEIIDQYLPKTVDFGNGATLAPDNQAYLDGARNRATLAQMRNGKDALAKSEMSITQAAANGTDPKAMLDAYAKQPGASYEFYRTTLDWFRNRGREAAADALNSSDAFELQSEVYLGHITSAAQAQQWVAANHYNGEAATQLMARAVSALGEVQHTNQADPNFNATREALSEKYAAIDPVTREWTSVDAKQRHANVMQSYVQNYNQLVNQGSSPADAAQKAEDKATQLFPIPQQNNTPARLPQSPQEQAAFVRNTSNLNPSALRSAGLDGSKIKQLRDRNLISSDEANAAAAALLNK